MAARRCILCGAAGPLTREHIWPQWYSDLHPGRRYRMETILGMGETPHHRNATSMDLQPRVLCRPCNEEWGERLEARVRPRFIGMLDGGPEIITLPFAQYISTWATLKIVASEHLTRSRIEVPFFTEEQRAYLRSKTRPPDSLLLWIGRYVGAQRDAGWLMPTRSWAPLLDDPTIGTDVYSATYSIGQILIQLVGVHAFPLDNDKERGASFHVPVRPGLWHEALLPIWPLPDKQTKWPPAKAFDDKGFQALAGRWHKQKPARNVKHQPAPKSARHRK